MRLKCCVKRGSLCEIGACIDQVSGVDACVQRAAAAKSRQQRAPPNGRGRHTSSHSQMSALSLCDTQRCAQNWCGGAPKTTVSLLLNSGCRIYAGVAQRQSGGFVHHRSRFRNSPPAPGVDAITGVCGPHKVGRNRRVLQFTTDKRRRDAKETPQSLLRVPKGRARILRKPFFKEQRKFKTGPDMPNDVRRRVPPS